MNLHDWPPAGHPVWKMLEQVRQDIENQAMGFEIANFLRTYLGPWASNGKRRARLTPEPA